MRTKALTVIFFALMLSAATLASEQHRRVELRIQADDHHEDLNIELNFDDMEIHEDHKIHVVKKEVDVTN